MTNYVDPAVKNYGSYEAKNLERVFSELLQQDLI